MWLLSAAIAAGIGLQAPAAPSQPPSTPAAPASQDAKPLGWVLDDVSGEMTHESTGVRFPKGHGDLVRGNVTTGDDQGQDVSVTYGRPGGIYWATVYLYPRKLDGVPDPRNHFGGVLDEIERLHDGAHQQQALEGELAVGGRRFHGYLAVYTYKTDGRPVASLAVLVPVGERFVKVRATRYLTGDAEGDGKDLLETTIDLLSIVQLEP